jgi:thiamine-monophosphate kinase
MNEFELIKRFTAAFDVPPAPAGPGDDCAVLPPSRATTVVTTDALVEGVHFTRRTFSLEDIGHKALAVNLSDLAAMGASPTWFVCALGLPPDVDARDLRALAGGMSQLARAHRARLVGGNLTRSLQLTVTITAAGEVRRPLLRSGARAGDTIYLSGHVGDAGAGLTLLRRQQIVGAEGAVLLAAQRRPAPHLVWGRAAAAWASAAIDASDGLGQDLEHLCRASGVAATLASKQLPVSEALLAWAGSRARVLELALRGGEDYVLVVTVPAARRAAFERGMAAQGLSAFPVGLIARGAGVRVDGRKVKHSGFLHFT